MGVAERPCSGNGVELRAIPRELRRLLLSVIIGRYIGTDSVHRINTDIAHSRYGGFAMGDALQIDKEDA
ncbi:hypothetical protein OEIGOIKO_00849 [Streptomyces chrestomyceticus JCM 4735]|uniref:Uncharacterized protein n=1 Tax=Streptomyces chrestomyceticus JCM 4735 TaxID=1306181 RepID=A0A7U9PW91_9ACTN|nr:hypothetical protein OEIGOIKO_00849 [Streptomyces chrestomyceticus JCM 4735]